MKHNHENRSPSSEVMLNRNHCLTEPHQHGRHGWGWGWGVGGQHPNVVRSESPLTPSLKTAPDPPEQLTPKSALVSPCNLVAKSPRSAHSPPPPPHWALLNSVNSQEQRDGGEDHVAFVSTPLKLFLGFGFSRPSPCETEPFLGASETRNVHSIVFLMHIAF